MENSSKVALITGAGRGIGAATAALFAQQGYAICINYRVNQQAALQTQTKIEAKGAKCILVQADVSQATEVEQLFKVVDEKLGPISVLVNNAGILMPQTSLLGMDQARINHILTTNISSCMLCSQQAVKRMSTSLGGAGGCIINVSSAAAKTGSPFEYLDYAASKGAIDTFTIGLAKEVAADGIRVNAVRPGFIYTDMHKDGGEPDRVDRLKSQIPLRRGGSPEEVAEAIYWLASDQASYVTGNFIDVAGGV